MAVGYSIEKRCLSKGSGANFSIAGERSSDWLQPLAQVAHTGSTNSVARLLRVTGSLVAMGHGSIEYKGGVMRNCHEGTCEYLVDRLEEIALRPEYLAIAPAVELWKKALDVPPGSSRVDFDLVLADDATKTLFIEALTNVHGALKTDRAKDQTRQIIKFLALGEQALDRVFRPDPGLGHPD